MASGGARAHSGPPPDPNAFRRDRKSDAASWVTLPRTCELPAPEWPLIPQSEREAQLWERIWTYPQASKWHEMALADEVALYCRYLVEAEEPGATGAVRTLVKQHREELGLSTSGMARLRWKIVPDEVLEKRQERSATTRSTRRDGAAMRERLKKIQGGA